MHIGTFSNVVVSWINFVYFWLNNYISCLMKIQTCTILFHRIFKVSETDFNMFFFWVFFVLFLVTLSSTVCLYGLLHYRVPCVGVCVCMPFPALCLCVCPVVSQLTERACMCVCLSECVCVFQSEMSVSFRCYYLRDEEEGFTL